MPRWAILNRKDEVVDKFIDSNANALARTRQKSAADLSEYYLAHLVRRVRTTPPVGTPIVDEEDIS